MWGHPRPIGRQIAGWAWGAGLGPPAGWLSLASGGSSGSAFLLKVLLQADPLSPPPVHSGASFKQRGPGDEG